MRWNYIKKIAVMSLTLPIISIADANEATNKPMDKPTAKYNFFTVKAGIAQPTNLGNTAASNGSTTYTAGTVLGRKFMDIFSVDGEYMLRGNSKFSSSTNLVQPSNEFGSWNIRSNTFTLNASVDLVNTPVITAYVRAGAGISINRSSNYTYNNEGNISTYPGKTTNSFAWQVGLGANFKSTKMLDTQVEYMFVDRGKVSTQAYYTTSSGTNVSAPPISGRLKDHTVTIGLKFNF